MNTLAPAWRSKEKRLADGVIVVALGGNLGGPRLVKTRFDRAIAYLSREWGPAQVSTILVTAPVGEVQAQPEFLNAVAAWRPASAVTPESALAQLQEMEAFEGRTRLVVGGPRSLDLDLLLVGLEERNHAELVLPHPRIHKRAFVLEPLCELFGADFRLSSEGQTLGHFLASAEVAAQSWSRFL